MAILLKILSIIGIVILCIIGFLLLLLLLVLFFPITYRIDGIKEAQKTEGKIKVSWLFGFVRALISYPGEDLLKIYVLFFRINKKKKTKQKDAATSSDETAEAKPEQPAGEEKESIADNSEEDAASKPETDTQETSGIKDAKPESEDKKEKKKFSFKEKYDKIIHIRDNIEYYKELLTSRKTKELFQYCKGILFKVLKHICPRRGKGRILYGTGSPDTTGYLYGVYGVLMCRLPKKFIVIPDFNEAIIEGEIKLRGHIVLGYLAIQGLKLFFNKPLKQFIRKLKAGGNQ